MAAHRINFDSDSGRALAWREVALAWLLSRALLWAFVWLGHSAHAASGTRLTTKLGGWEGVSSPLLNPWTTFDSRHFLDIAQGGYTPYRAAFFPLYPLLLRVLGGSGASQNTLALVGVVVSNCAFLLALGWLYALTRDEWGEGVARRALWLEAFFPAAAFGAAVYSESLFLALSLGLFWFARRKQWGLSALCGVLAGLTRNSGPLLCLALLLDRPKNPLSPRETRGRLGAALCPLGTFIAVQLAFFFGFGRVLASFASQSEFGRAKTFFALPLWLDARNLAINLSTWLDFITFPQLAACLGTFALIIAFWRRFSRGKLLFVGAIVLLNLSASWTTEPHTNSTLRFLFATFPAVQLLALAGALWFPSGRATLYLGTLWFTLFFLHSYLFGLRSFLG